MLPLSRPQHRASVPLAGGELLEIDQHDGLALLFEAPGFRRSADRSIIGIFPVYSLSCSHDA
jgi:hypothetical protein